MSVARCCRCLAVLLFAAGVDPVGAEVPFESSGIGPAAHRSPIAEQFDASLEDIVAAVEGRTPRPDASERVSVLVEVLPGRDRSSVRDFARARGGHARYEYSILPRVLNLRGIPRDALADLRRLPVVMRVEEDRAVRIDLNDSTPHIRALQSQVQGAGLAVTGSGARVCVIDTGIDADHTMFASRVDALAGFDFANGDSDPADDHGHGSHVAGIALGRTGFHQY